MRTDGGPLGTKSEAIFAELAVALRRRRPQTWSESGHFATDRLPFTAFMSLGHDNANPDEDIAVTIDVTPDRDRLVACVARYDGLVLVEEEYPLVLFAGEYLDAAMAKARDFFLSQVDVIIEALASFDSTSGDDRDAGT